jgi:tRNA A-37 threonylcarbamoyl transferase component Bud32
MIQWGQIDPTLRQALEKAGLDSVASAFEWSQGQDLDKPNLGTRRRTRFQLVDEQGRQHELYLKRYGPAKWWRRLGKFSSPAQKEFSTIQRVRQAGVPTMCEAIFGEECPLTDGRSFIVVTAVPGEALERGGARYFDCSDANNSSVIALTDELAQLVHKLHQANMVHRDLYASHIFVQACGAGASLHLIDLARVFRPCLRQFRWRVKDLAQLHFSMPAAWVQNHWSRFLEQYLGQCEPDVLAKWQKAVEKKSLRIRCRCQRKAARSKQGGQA